MTDNGLPAGFGTNNPDFIKDAYVESQKMRGDDSGGSVLFIKTGVTHCRVLPPHEDSPSWFRLYKEHGLRPGGKFRTYTCPADGGDECPICDEGNRLYELGGENLKRAKQLYPKQAFLYNVYVYSSPDGKELKDGIFVLKSGVKVYKQLMEFDNDPAGDWGDISDLQSGIDFRITRKGQGRYKTEYNVSGIPSRSNVIEKVAAAGLEFGAPTDLTKVYPALDYDELVTALEEDEPEQTD
jgi:hypothetical protein